MKAIARIFDNMACYTHDSKWANDYDVEFGSDIINIHEAMMMAVINKEFHDFILEEY